MLRQKTFKSLFNLSLRKGYLIKTKQEQNKQTRLKKLVDTSATMGSKYLRGEKVRQSPTKKLTILTEAKYVSGKWDDKLECDVEMDKAQKVWTINPETNENIGLKYGTDSKKWIGKVIKLTVITLKTGNDMIVGVPE